jgi:hypothetical protein
VKVPRQCQLVLLVKKVEEKVRHSKVEKVERNEKWSKDRRRVGSYSVRSEL